MRILLWNILNDTANIITAEKPSKLLPFKGNFPLLTVGKERMFDAGCENKKYLDECEDWIQNILLTAQRILDIDNGFLEYLKSNNILKKYCEMDAKQKVKEIKRFFDTTILDVEDLIIKEDEYGKL